MSRASFFIRTITLLSEFDEFCSFFKKERNIKKKSLIFRREASSGLFTAKARKNVSRQRAYITNFQSNHVSKRTNQSTHSRHHRLARNHSWDLLRLRATGALRPCPLLVRDCIHLSSFRCRLPFHPLGQPPTFSHVFQARTTDATSYRSKVQSCQSSFRRS